jgi:hypothetical protein
VAQAAPQHPDPEAACAKPTDGEQATREQRAGEHYLRGQELYAGGEYELAIPEFHTAFCLLPKPAPLYNIAQSYERLVDYERAVRWFERYIREPGQSQEEIDTVAHRIRQLRKLPARIRVSTDPPGASIRLDGNGQQLTGKANDPEPLRLPAGTYTMVITLAGHTQVTERVVAEIGQPYTYSYRLIPHTGTLRVVADPPSARILVDDRIAGIGSYVDRLPIGPHRITVEAEARPPAHRLVTVGAAEEQTVRVRLDNPRPRNGKLELLIASPAVGLIEGSVFAAGLTDDSRVISLVALAMGGVGLLVPALILPSYVPVGATSLAIGGRLWGAAEGAALVALFSPDNPRAAGMGAVVGSVLVGAAGYLVARRLDTTAGDAALVNTGALWGSTAGLLVNAAFSTASAGDRLLGPLLLGGVNIGLLTGVALASQVEWSRGHVALIDLSAFAGMVSGTALALVVQVGGGSLEDSAANSRNAARFALAGLGIGLVVGTLLTRTMDLEVAVEPSISAVSDARGRSIATFGFGGTW